MTLTINGEFRDFDADEMPLPELLDSLGLGGKPVVVELDRQALRPADYPHTTVADGAALEIIRIAAGG